MVFARPLWAAWAALDLFLRWLTTWLVLAGFYLAVLTPLALLFRALGRDALGLRRRDCPTYWSEKPAAGPRSYFRSC